MSGENAQPEALIPSVHFTTHIHVGTAHGSHHKAEGNVYQGNTTGGSSVGVYGQVGHLHDPLSTPTAEHKNGQRCNVKSQFINPNHRSTDSVEISPTAEPTPITARSRSHSRSRQRHSWPFVSSTNLEGLQPTNMTHAPEPVPPLTAPIDSAHRPSGNPNAPGPSDTAPNTQITQITVDPVPEVRFMRRDTVSWFGHGKVVKISEEPYDQIITNRCMVVIGRSSELVCLPLCMHSQVTSGDKDFLKTRLLLQPIGAGPATPFGATSIEMRVEPGITIRDNVWVNCGKPHTIHHSEMAFAHLGDLTEDALATLTKAYLSTQREMARPRRLHLVLRDIWVRTPIPFFHPDKYQHRKTGNTAI